MAHAKRGTGIGGRVSLLAMSISYLERLGQADPITVLEATPIQLLTMADGLAPSDWARSYAPGKWDAAAILAHLADVETVMGFRLRQAVGGEKQVQSFDPDLWAKRYRRMDPSLALELFRAQRAWNLALFATFDLDDWLTEMLHPVRGPESVDVVVRQLAGHDLNHLEQLKQAWEG